MTSNFDKVEATDPISFDQRFSAQGAGHAETTESEHGTLSDSSHEPVIEKHKFVGRNREREEILKRTAPHIEMPADIRRWSEVLGLYADFTADDVHKAWRAQISSPAVHPDLGGEVEQAILLNTAKDSLVKWLDSFQPKLGKQFLRHK